MILNLALYLETNKLMNITQGAINSLIDRVRVDGGIFENYNCLNSFLNSSGGLNGVDSVYIRADLFNDETISITQVIQDVQDISLIFTNFTKTFSLPASDAINRLFKHYYNYDNVFT
jgi:hypothetical protein